MLRGRQGIEERKQSGAAHSGVIRQLLQRKRTGMLIKYHHDGHARYGHGYSVRSAPIAALDIRRRNMASPNQIPLLAEFARVP